MTEWGACWWEKAAAPVKPTSWVISSDHCLSVLSALFTSFSTSTSTSTLAFAGCIHSLSSVWDDATAVWKTVQKSKKQIKEILFFLLKWACTSSDYNLIFVNISLHLLIQRESFFNQLCLPIYFWSFAVVHWIIRLQICKENISHFHTLCSCMLLLVCVWKHGKNSFSQISRTSCIQVIRDKHRDPQVP